MIIKPSLNPGAAPAAAFENALENIRKFISARGEVAQVRNLISPKAISELNHVAMKQYDDNVCAVRFYGGMIHRYPEATFEIEDGKSGITRDTCRELADLMLVVVFLEPGPGGKQTHKGSRACLIQAKTSAAAKGAKFSKFNPASEDTKPKTGPEQFYLLNMLPPFELKGEKPAVEYDLRPMDTDEKPLAKYCFLWQEKAGAALPSTWSTSWQCCAPVPDVAADQSFGSLLAELIDSHPDVGRDCNTAIQDDWDKLITQLTSHCKVNEWGKESKLVDPIGVSFVSRIAAFGTLMQHARSTIGFSAHRYSFLPYVDARFRKFPPPSSDLPDSKGMPVLVISVSSFVKTGDFEELTPEARGSLMLDAIRTIRGL